MSESIHLLASLYVRGVDVFIDGDEIRCRADAGTLTTDDAHALRALKPEIVARLTDQEIEIGWRVDAMRLRIGDGPLPERILVDDLPETPGQCFSCGEPMPLDQIAKCTLCCLAAARIVLADMKNEDMKKGTNR